MKSRFIQCLLSVTALSLAVACEKHEYQPDTFDSDGRDCRMTFYADADAETKTVLQQDGSIFWSAGDNIKIAVFDNYGSVLGSGVFTSDTSKECASSKFIGYFDDAFSLNSVKWWIGLYPSVNSAVERKNKYVQVQVKGIQTSRANTFSSNHFPAAAVTETDTLKFKNLCGGFKITVSKKGIRKIVLRPNWGEKFGFIGTVQITKSDSISESQLFKGFDVIYNAEYGSSVTLTAKGGGVFEPGKAYYATAIPQHVIGGLTIDYYGSDSLYRFTSKNDFDIVRSKFGKLENLDAKAKGVKTMSSSNCYLIYTAGAYSFPTVKGNSTESVGAVKSVKVLWESFGTSTAPVVGDIISSVSYSDGKIIFTVTDKKGNAVIAAYDGENGTGNILWSWHIWCTDLPEEQVYNNGAGTMMDRNLGATDTTRGSVGALGLLYQWGRKDPFLGSSSISSSTTAKSTGTWPSATLSTATIAYAVRHPMQFIRSDSKTGDWCYGSSTENTRWHTYKGLYDPCPAGWRVPNGWSSGVWSTAFGTSSYWTKSSNWDGTNKGMDFGKTDKKLMGTGSDRCWYPAAGSLDHTSGGLYSVSIFGFCWSCTPIENDASYLYFDSDGEVRPSSRGQRARGLSVRCVKK